MPIYEYRCSACGFKDEFLQKVSEPPLTMCPSCGKKKFKKLLSAAGFQLKGSGWYATDFRSSGTRKPTDPKPETKAEAKTETKAETKTETKSTESKTETKAEKTPASTTN